MCWSDCLELRSIVRMTHAFTLFDVAIGGGGPAGAVAAILLARAGYRVGLATLPPRGERIEGLSRRVVSILRANDLPLCGVAAPTQRRAQWGDFAGDQNVEHIVRRRDFDRGLLERARSEGVLVLDGAISAIQSEASVIHMADGRSLLAGLLFDARGRRAPRMEVPGSQRSRTIGPDAISVSGFLAPGGPRPAGSEIRAHPEGWTWRARLGDGRDWLQVVGDKSAVRGGRTARDRLVRLWRHVVGAGAALGGLPDRPSVSAANLRLNAPDLDPRCPRLGDAAVALDPLSGHGVFWAVSSALMASPIARSLLGGQTDLARDFYRNRVVDTFWRQARIGRDFHAASGQDGEFWRHRRQWPDAEPAHPQFDRPRLEPRVLLRDGVLCRGEVLVTNADPGGAAFVLGQEIAPILRAIGNRPLPDMNVFHKTYLPMLPARTAGQVHGWLIARGLGTSPAVQC